MTLFTRIHNFVTKHNLIPPESTVLLGLSGGPDSVFLLHYLMWAQKHLPFSLMAAHLDHQWRADSAEDATFCTELAQHYDISFFTQKADAVTLQYKPQSKEEEGRLLRRAFFENIAAVHHVDRIALAHHMDDQRETFFIRLLRGAGITGLSGIHPQRGIYIHPLLTITKNDILTYLQKHDISYREDPTNKHPEFLRNCIRHTGIPALESCDPRLPASLDRTMDQLREADAFIESYIDEQFSLLSTDEHDVVYLPLDQLFTYHSYIQKRLLLKLLITTHVPFTPSQPFLEEIIRFLHQKKSTSHQLGPDWYIRKKAGFISIQRDTQ